jgi:hypothetical protein
LSPARRAVREGLIRLGGQPVTRPSFAFKARLEGELIGGVEAPSGVTLLSLPRRHGRRLPAVTLAAASVAGVVLGGALLGAFGHGGTGALQLAAAVDTTVVMPGGQTVPGRTGLGLPDGSVVWTGPNGRAAAGPVELGPGIEGVVVDAGHLRLQPLPAGGTPSNLTPVTTPTIPSVVHVPAVNVPKVTLPTVPKVVPPTTLPLHLGRRH